MQIQVEVVNGVVSNILPWYERLVIVLLTLAVITTCGWWSKRVINPTEPLDWVIVGLGAVGVSLLLALVGSLVIAVIEWAVAG